ncbi:MAG: 2-dehydro-3-deoxygalactonokinase [Pyrinomonadaceae bacterium]
MPAAAADSAEPSCVVYVDAGTTNTRVWLAKDQKILARETATVGVRDTARDKSAHKLRAALTNLIREVSQGAPQNKPRCVIASGMITSSLGLAEVPHITAPAGLRELAAGVEFHRFADITDLPFLLVPGVRCGPPNAAEVENIGEVDLMRGEETLCIGLIESGMLNSHSALLNLGSHWKAIKVDDDQRIQQSVTRLTGEMIQAVQEHTVLASAVTQEKPTTPRRGMANRRNARAASLGVRTRTFLRASVGTGEPRHTRRSFVLSDRRFYFLVTRLDGEN